MPAYQALLDQIRASPSLDIDETPWSIQDLNNRGYAWVVTDNEDRNVYFRLAPTRGASIAQQLLKDYQGVRISDDYSAYLNSKLPGKQQTCSAHLYRKIRDLANTKNVSVNQQDYVNAWYQQLSNIYSNLRFYLKQPFSFKTRQTQADQLFQQTQQLINLPVPTNGEPTNLTRLRAQLQPAGKQRLFTCPTSNTDCDNNRAERALRPLVLKRKRSLGSRTEKGADSFSVIFSLCATVWKHQPDSYFKALAAIG